MDRILKPYTSISGRSIARFLVVNVAIPALLFTLAAYVLRWTHVMRPAVFPYPHEVFSAGSEVLMTDKGLFALLITLRRLAVVFLVSLGLGMAMAFLFHQFRILAEVFALPVDLVRSVPVVTFFPLFVTLWGFTETTFLAVPILMTSVIMYIHLSAGLNDIAPMRRMLMRRWGAGRLQMIWHLSLPSIAPHLFTSLRVCASLQLILILVAEMFLGAKEGLGTLIHDYQTVLEYDRMYFFIMVSGVLGWLVNRSLEFLQRRVIFWQEPNHD